MDLDSAPLSHLFVDCYYAEVTAASILGLISGHFALKDTAMFAHSLQNSLRLDGECF